MWITFALFLALSAGPLAAENRFIVRTDNGLLSLKSICAVLGCTVRYGLDGSLGQVFLVTTSDLVDPSGFLKMLTKQAGVSNVELDLLGKVTQSYSVPTALWDTSPVNYYGTTVRSGYVNQPAAQIIALQLTQDTFNVRGGGTVAVIDTGVDPNHPALKSVLVSGYDFTRNKDGMPSEASDLNQSTAALVDGTQTSWVNQSTAALVDQSTAALVDDPKYAAFGHGTMVAGIIHLVAPKASIMPLKAFRADGSGYTSDILRAIYRAVQNNAKVINMSFSFPSASQEIQQAVRFADRNGVICVASVGNHGKNEVVYPAAFGEVIGVASTTNADIRSDFSNYGSVVWVAAPGEGIVTTYPFGSYAAAWGTSFSTPFVSGAASLLVDMKSSVKESDAKNAVGNAKFISVELGKGRLDLHRAVQAWRNASGGQ